jgi:hypothetical protein
MPTNLMTEVSIAELDVLLDQHRYPILEFPRVISDEISHDEQVLCCCACITGHNNDICEFIIVTDYKLIVKVQNHDQKIPLEEIDRALIINHQEKEGSMHIKIDYLNFYRVNLIKAYKEKQSIECDLSMDLSQARSFIQLVNSKSADAFVRVRSKK